MTNQTVSPALQQIEAALHVTSGTFEKKITALFLTSPASPANSLLPTISTGWAPAAAEPGTWRRARLSISAACSARIS